MNSILPNSLIKDPFLTLLCHCSCFPLGLDTSDIYCHWMNLIDLLHPGLSYHILPCSTPTNTSEGSHPLSSTSLVTLLQKEWHGTVATSSGPWGRSVVPILSSYGFPSQASPCTCDCQRCLSLPTAQRNESQRFPLCIFSNLPFLVTFAHRYSFCCVFEYFFSFFLTQNCLLILSFLFCHNLTFLLLQLWFIILKKCSDFFHFK